MTVMKKDTQEKEATQETVNLSRNEFLSLTARLNKYEKALTNLQKKET
jgi:hypothetical protein